MKRKKKKCDVSFTDIKIVSKLSIQFHNFKLRFVSHWYVILDAIRKNITFEDKF